MAAPNRDHVAIRPDLDCSWTFVLPSDASTCSGATKDVRSVCEALFGAFGDFVVPTAVAHSLLLVPDGQRVQRGNESVEPQDEIQRRLSDRTGVDVLDVLDSIDVSGSEAVWLPRLRIEGMRILLTLASGDGLASRDTRSASYRSGSPLDREPQYDPLSIYVEHAPNVDEDHVDSPFVTYVRVNAHSDIWFEDTDIGRRNRERLAEFLDRLRRSLPVATIHRDSNRFSRDHMATIV